ncbi:urate hydroxylase PuuD [Neotamlana laminarinivorans]|uniref:Urate hydroxylase PuuD n=1 Tax=Neotamlana laminarinivorans TaxID=2883124 RepID=A0A9X1HYE1_9FLAO|nr:urate hydroxylase PuuD [Tamlana laminarinivorans]MCB4798190.1 urate hydroxylase PuuD [Tamlana laminarinivorans]
MIENLEIMVLIAWLIIFTVIVGATYKIRHYTDTFKKEGKPEKAEALQNTQNTFYALVVIASLAGVGVLYLFLKDTVYESHFFEWLNLTVRLIHITFGIAWIGASFYFVFLENALNRKNVRDELAGDLWAVHGGGFYYLEKYKVAPKQIPKHLHWFKYEAYFTWLSGFCLLSIVYYFNANSYLIDPDVLDILPWQAVAIGVSSFIVGWICYDIICKKINKNKILFTVAITLMVIVFAWFYSQVFSGRGAYIHFGAFLGTLMAGNVFFVIIPGQKRMVNAAKKGLKPNPEDGKAAQLRSYTNNYFTLPVLFVMISNHFPSTFGNTYQWLILLGITVGTAGVKHYLNLREKGEISVWIMPASVIILLGMAFITAPEQPKYKNCETIVSFAEVKAIVQNRCIVCHSENPTDEIWKVAPNGVKYDTPEQIYSFKDKIFQRAVVSKNMPFNNNQTGMTEEERDIINCWITQGAPNE